MPGPDGPALRLATDVDLVPAHVPVVPFLAPIVPPSGEHRDDTTFERRFAPWAAIAPGLLELSDLEHADVAVIPADWYWVRGPSWASRPDRAMATRFGALHERARRAGVPTVVFFSGDRSSDRVGLGGAIVHREGAFASAMSRTDHALPAFCEDLVEHYFGGVPVERPYRDRPLVGFCGLAGAEPSAWRRAAKLVAFKAVVATREHRIDPSPRTGERMREVALDLLARHADVDTDFVIRRQSVFFGADDPGEMVRVRREYVDNLAGCDYVLCVRGSGNYSYRLYEALSMGRTPVIVDTDLELPCADVVEWRTRCVWVAPRQLPVLAEVVRDFHARLTPETFADQQRWARSTWLEHLAADSFFGRLARDLRRRPPSTASAPPEPPDQH